MRTTIAAAAIMLVAATSASAAKSTRFWNLTENTITNLQFAPAGTETFGPNQCENDKDKTVEHDERLKIVGLASGTYDARLTDAKHRTCTVKNVSVTEGDVFSIEEKQLAGACGK